MSTTNNPAVPSGDAPVAGHVNATAYGGSLSPEEAVQKAAADFGIDPNVLRNR